LLLLNAFKKGGRFAAVVVVPNCCPIPEGGRFAALVVVPNCPKETNYFAFKKAAASVRSCCYLICCLQKGGRFAPVVVVICCLQKGSRFAPVVVVICSRLLPNSKKFSDLLIAAVVVSICPIKKVAASRP